MILLTLILHLAAPAPSAAAFSCPMFDALHGDFQNCDDNAYLSQAALDCTQSYYNHVQAAQADVLKKFQEQVAAQKSLQNDAYDRTQDGYRNARAQLEGLINDGKSARAAVDDLYVNFYFPEDYDEPETTHMAPREYLDANECYAAPEQVVLKCQKMIDKIMADLRATEEAAFGKQNTSTTRSAHVQELDHTPTAATTYGKGSGSVKGKGGDNRNPASDITGTKPPGADELPTK